jgi:hypothetical protein
MNFNEFKRNQEVVNARNLLLGRRCDNCFLYHGGREKCSTSERIPTYLNLPLENTCSKWKKRF